VLLMVRDIGPLGGVFRVTEGRLQAVSSWGTTRIRDTPLAESGIVGRRDRLAMRGYRPPVCEIQFDGFIFPGFNQITSPSWPR
jgi:pyruvate dehydrogenase E1 component beta subunit